MLVALLPLFLLSTPVVCDGVDVTGWTTAQLWEKSDEYFHHGDYLKSVHLLQEVVRLDPSDVRAYGVAAWLVWSLGDEPTARQWLHRCVAMNPQAWEAHFELGSHFFNRLGDPAAALPSLRESLRCAGCPDTVPRMLAHALLADERPGEAVAMWRRIGAAGTVPPAVVANNLAHALQTALHSDMLARDGGVIDGPADPASAPRIVRDTRYDDDHRGYPDRRVLELADPSRGDDHVVARIVYHGQRTVYVTYWQWVTITTEAGGTLLNSDGDGTAGSVPPLERLRALRGASLSPLVKRLAAPDRYALEVDSHGWFQPLVPREIDGAVSFKPALVIACEDHVTLRLALRETVHAADRKGPEVVLPSGVYAANEGDGPTVAPALRAADLPAPGRYAVAVELLRAGVIVARRTNPSWLVSSDGTRVTVVQPQPWEADIWGHNAPRPLGDATEPAPKPAAAAPAAPAAPAPAVP